MRIFFDTEFLEDGQTIQLISIGMVREDGATLYEETPHAEGLAKSNDWLAANVLPHLKLTGPILERSEIAAKIVEFVGEKPEFWAYYADYDWVALCQLFGRMLDLPDGWPMYCRDLKQLADERNVRLPKQVGDEHNALADALWVRDSHQLLV
jgi:hypothetical protein